MLKKILPLSRDEQIMIVVLLIILVLVPFSIKENYEKRQEFRNAIEDLKKDSFDHGYKQGLQACSTANNGVNAD